MMAGLTFQRATRRQARLRLALIGPSGSGKTYSALCVGRHLGERVALIDTEHGSASKYAHLCAFDVLELASFHPQRYIEAIQAADEAGYDVLIVDSLSHAWMGKDGALELVDRAAKRSQSGNSFGAWRDVTPLHNALVEALVACRAHLIVTMRAKTDYVQERDDKTGRTTVRKIGLAPVQRDGLEYEFDVVGDLDLDNNLTVTKSRCEPLTGALIRKPGQQMADTLRAWLAEGAAPELLAPPASDPPVAAGDPSGGPAPSADPPADPEPAAGAEASSSAQARPPRFTGGKNEQGQAFLTACRDELGLEIAAVQELLGGRVRDYLDVCKFNGEADVTFDDVYDRLEARVHRDVPISYIAAPSEAVQYLQSDLAPTTA